MSNYYEDLLNTKRSSDLKLIIDDIQTTSDLYYIALMVLSSQVGGENIFPELTFLMDPGSLEKLLSYYGGQTITLPTLEDVRFTLQAIMMYYYYDIKHYSWQKCFQKLGIEYSGQLSRKFSWYRHRIIKALKDVKIPEVSSHNEM